MGNNSSQPEGKAGLPSSGDPQRRSPIKSTTGATPSQPGSHPSPRLPVLPHHRTTGQHPSGTVSPGGPLSPLSPTYGIQPNSPRRRKSLELPDLNRLTITPTAPTHPVSGGENAISPTAGQQERSGFVGGGAGGGKLSPLGMMVPAMVGDDEHMAPTTSPPAGGNKRLSLMSGTRAKSPHRSSGSQGGSESTGSAVGTPIPGASPTRKKIQTSSTGRGNDNPYFPAMQQIGQYDHQASSAAPVPQNPGLPNYSNSPSNEMGTFSHTEYVSSSTKPATDPSIPSQRPPPINTNQQTLAAPGAPSSSGRQPSPAKPAPAIVTREILPNSPENRPTRSTGEKRIPLAAQIPAKSHGHDVIQSSLPKGSSPVEDRATYPGGAAARSPPGSPAPVAMREGGLSTSPTPVPTGATFASQQRTNPPPYPPSSLTEQQQQQAKKEVATETEDALVPTMVTWTGGGRDVYVTGTFAEGGWKNRIRMEKSTHDFSLMLNLPPGTHRLKFIVDDHWRCSNDLQTATDGDGNLVNWIEVESETARKGADEDWAVQEWTKKITSAAVDDGDDPLLWTSEIPPALINFQITEERALASPPDDLPHHSVSSYRQNQSALLASVPVPPTLPRHLEKVILNTTPKELEGAIGGQGGDDNSILPVPNHVVLQHLTASAIKNGTLAVGTTTRYKRKYISTIFFKPVGEY